MLKRTKEFVTEFEQTVNLFSDMDREWWPFLFLRPAPHVRMSSARVALLATLYGGFVGMLANVLLTLTNAGATRPHVLTFPLWTTAAFFVVYRTTIAYFWNRRAARLAAGLRA